MTKALVLVSGGVASRWRRGSFKTHTWCCVQAQAVWGASTTRRVPQGWVSLLGEYLLLGWLVLPLHKGTHTHNTVGWVLISSEEDLTGSQVPC